MIAATLPKLSCQWLKFGSLATAFGGTCSLRGLALDSDTERLAWLGILLVHFLFQIAHFGSIY
jgi:hypothetical protein